MLTLDELCKRLGVQFEYLTFEQQNQLLMQLIYK